MYKTSTLQYKILIDEEFKIDLYDKLSRAKERIYLQFMTFEGDSAGLELSEKLIEAKNRGLDVRVVIDCFTDFFVSNKYYKNESVKKEVKNTKDMIERMKNAGIKVVRTRPFGPLKIFFASRNHKKIIIIDDSSYIGGINISDHNYSWHDMMVRFDEANITESLLKDYESTLRGEKINLDEKEIISNKIIESKFFQIIKEAREEIIISSPYFLSTHLIKAVRTANVKIKLLTLEVNNFKIINLLTKYIFPLLSKYNVDIYFYKQFSHVKFIIADRKKVLFGSSNFGLDSFTCEQEIGAYIEDEEFAKNFYTKLLIKQQNTLEKYDNKVNKSQYYLAYVMATLAQAFFFCYEIITKSFIHELKE